MASRIAGIVAVLFACLGPTATLDAQGQSRVVEVRANGRTIRITTDDTRTPQPIRPGRTAKPPVASVVRPTTGSPFGLEVTVGTDGNVRSLPVEIADDRARTHLGTGGACAIRLHNDGAHDVAVRLYVGGRVTGLAEETDGILVPRGASVNVPVEVATGATLVTAVVRFAWGPDEPRPAAEPIGPGRTRPLTDLETDEPGGTGTAQRVVGTSPVAALSITLERARMDAP